MHELAKLQSDLREAAELEEYLRDKLDRLTMERDEAIKDRDKYQGFWYGRFDEFYVIKRERDEARERAADYRWECAEKDDDPEEWQRWAYRSGEPEWLEPPAWFIEKHPWMKKPEAA